jgi:hypothetical protein
MTNVQERQSLDALGAMSHWRKEHSTTGLLN